MKNNEQKKQDIQEVINNAGLSIDIYVIDELPDNFDELTEQLDEERMFDVEIIYYHNAIKYLSENDPSLKQSLEIAQEYGYELKTLSSEVMASLLASQNEREGWQELESEITDILES